MYFWKAGTYVAHHLRGIMINYVMLPHIIQLLSNLICYSHYITYIESTKSLIYDKAQSNDVFTFVYLLIIIAFLDA